jgi:FixJ family two-component response regulator
MLDTKPHHLLLIDNDDASLEAVTAHATAAGWQVEAASSAAQAIRDLRDLKPEVICTRLELPMLSGRHVLRAVAAVDPDLPVVVFSDAEDLVTAIQLMRAGAFDCLGPPASNLDQLMGALERASDAAATVRERRAMRAELDDAQAKIARHLEQETNIRQRALEHIEAPMQQVFGQLHDLKALQISDDARLAVDSVLNSMLIVRKILDRAESDSTISGTDSLTLNDFHLQEVVEFARDAVLRAAHDAQVELAFFVPGNLAPMRGDPQQLRHALVGLLNFLLKAKTRGTVHLEVLATQHGSGPWVCQFNVSDHEGGARPEGPDTLTSQLPGDMRATQSKAAVDLSISAREIALMGGELELIEQRSVGRRLSFTTAFLTAKRMDKALVDPLLPSADVLVVESNGVVRRSITNEANKLGLNSGIASSVEQAIASLQRGVDGDRPIRVILISLALPDRERLTRFLDEMGDSGPSRIFLARSGEFTATSDGFLLTRPPRRDDLIRLLKRILVKDG